MYTTIKKFCEDNSSDNGLLLIDSPTGSGKTHSVLDFIFDASQDIIYQDRKFIFITTQKKNLPQNDLRERFANAGKTNLFNEKFLFLDSLIDSIIDGFDSEVEKSIPDELQKTETYKKFAENVKMLRNYKFDKKYSDMKNAMGAITDQLRKTYEPPFRRAVAAMLSHEAGNLKDKLYRIKTDKRWQWVGKLYPSVFISERQIIFMSVDKFLLSIASPVEPSFLFYSSRYMDKAIVFIDEFDATKDTILDRIINDGLQGKIDYIYLFTIIYNALMTKKFPESMTRASETRKEGPYKDQSLKTVLDGVRQRAQKIYNDYYLSYSHRTVLDDNESMNKNFLFQDYQYRSILDADKSYVVVENNSVETINEIRFSKEKPQYENHNVHNLLGSVRGFIKYFRGAVNILAINYTERKKERKNKDDDEFTMESAIRSILAEFNLPEKYIDFLTSEILVSNRKNKSQIQGSTYDLSLYENGFRYYAFEDDVRHDMHSTIMMYSFQNTPEKMLVKFCDRAKVIGISATASLETIIGNYDLRHLRRKMQGAFHKVSIEDKARMKESFDRTIKGYENVNINTELIGAESIEDYSIDLWNNIFDDRQLSEKIFNTLKQNTYEYNSKDPTYNQRRYYRIAKAYKEFILHDDIKSFLCVLTKHPVYHDRCLAMERLHEIFDYICRSAGYKYDKNSIVVLKTDEFDLQKAELCKRFESGEKIFVISVYQTIGAGQNLQYPIPESIRNDLVCINSFPKRPEKDFDAIYLDKPTHLLVLLGKELKEPDFAKYLYQVEFFQESSEISGKEAYSHIHKAFDCLSNGDVSNNIYAKNLYETGSYALLATRTVIQAIGRICRTNMKNKNIYIYADSTISSYIDTSVEQKIMLNPEFRSLLNVCKETKTAIPSSYSYINAAETRSKRVYKAIMNLLQDDWDKRRINQWRDFRELVLMHPTCSQDFIDRNFIAYNYYVELPECGNKIYYKQEQDFNSVQVRFNKEYGFSSEVSSDAARLDLLLGISGVRELFVEKGWATSFENNKYIMAPMLFQNIYKGVLGEVIGKYLFESRFGITLSDIEEPEIFEMFDFRVPNTDIFVDFKHWQESTYFDRNKEYKKTLDKARKCHAKCVIVANIISEKNYSVNCNAENDVEIVAISSLVIYENEKYSICREAYSKIEECVRKYANKD